MSFLAWQYFIYVHFALFLFLSCSVVSDSLWPHGLQHARLPCPSLSPRVCSNSCPLNQWCHPTISSSVIPFSSCLQTFLASGSFPNSLLSASGGQSTGASASATVFPKNTQGWFSLGLTWFDLFAAQGTLKSLLQHHNSKASVLQHSASFMVQLSHSYVTTGKTIALTRRSFVSQVLAGGLVVRILHSHAPMGFYSQSGKPFVSLSASHFSLFCINSWNFGLYSINFFAVNAVHFNIQLHQRNWLL